MAWQNNAAKLHGLFLIKTVISGKKPDIERFVQGRWHVFHWNRGIQTNKK
jgi:hypothetical protein